MTRNEEKYLKAIFDITPHIMITTVQEEIDYANKAMLKFFECKTLKEFKKNNSCICDFFISGDSYLSNDVVDGSWLEYILQNPKKLHKIHMKKGQKEYYFIIKAQHLEFDNLNRSVVTFNDITEIEYLRMRLDIAVNGANDGLWDWNIETGEIYFSPQWKKQLGYKDNELENTIKSWTRRIHPQDKDKVMKDYTSNMSGKNKHFENIYRLKHKDGSWVWILDRGQSIFNKDSKAIRMVGFHTNITQQKELEIELKNSQKQFLQFMEHIPANILIKEDDVIIYANSSANKFFNQKSIVGKTATDLLPAEISKEINSFEKKAFLDGGSQSIVLLNNKEKKVCRNLSFVINNKNNTKKTLGVVVIDITKEYNANKEISKLLSAFERSDISVLMTDLDAVIEYVNPKWCEVTGYSKEELIGQNPRIVKSKSNTDSVYKVMWDRISHGKVWNGEIKNIAKDGSEFWEESTIVPSFNIDGKVDGYISFKSEISEKIYLQQELRDKDEIMIAQSRHAAMGEMISMIAHQWRQPISAIAMDASNIVVDIELDMIETEELLNISKDIINQVAELSKTIDDFRDFFKPNKEMEDVLFKQVVDDVLNVIGKSLENNDIKLILNIDGKIKIRTFSRELMQVLINIIKNSKEALIDKNVANKRICIDLTKDKNNIIIKIKDNAGGIDSKVIDKIFDPYFTTKGEKTGTGLGLYISKTIIEKHLKGFINVSNQDDGVLFEVKLPLNLNNQSKRI